MIELKDNRYKDMYLEFHADGHKYNDNFGNEYLSCTTFLHRYKPEFNKKYWLAKKAKEYGITERQLEKQWEKITKEACERGSNTHDGLETGIKEASQFKNAIKYLNKEKEGVMTTVADIPLFNADYCLLNLDEFIEKTNYKYPKIYECFKAYTDAGYKIYSEIGMFLMDYLISGTIDILLVRDDKFIIGDWKTNRGGLKFGSGYYLKDKKQYPNQLTNTWIPKTDMLKAPVSNMPDCNGSIYNLQVSLYAYAVEQILNLPCGGCWLCHIDNDFVLNEYGQPKLFKDGYHLKDDPVDTVRFYTMPYRKHEIELMLKDRELEVKAIGVKNQFSLL